MSTSAKKVPIVKILAPVYAVLVILFGVLIARGNMQLLNPAGYIADMQAKIFWGALIFAAVVGITIITAFFLIVTHYKEGSQRTYDPAWKANKLTLFLGWAIPLLAISAISVLVWDTAHSVDPYKPISSSAQPITIQVVALRWKWLFIYPDERLATVNMLEVPVNTPVNLQLTADAPMNSFWVPRLSGQVYAMTGMVTQLHIEANKVGSYPGSAAEISGDDFAGMDFNVKAVSAEDYAAWKSSVASATPLNYSTYTKLAQPSGYQPVSLYTIPDPSLFHEIVMQFMAPGANSSSLQVRGTNL